MGKIYELEENSAMAAAGYTPIPTNDDSDGYITEDEDECIDTHHHLLSLPNHHRLTVWSEQARLKGKKVVEVAGHLAWIFTTSMLLVGLPLLYAYDREKALPQEPSLK